MPGIGVPAQQQPTVVRMCPVTAGDQNNGDFEEFKGDIEAAERRVAREIDPGARALVIAIAVFVLLLTFVLPHTGGARGWDVLAGNDAAIGEGIALPSRVFTWLALVFGVGFSMLALLTRRWALAWIALAGSTVASFSGLLAVWSRQTAPAPHPGPGIGLILAWLAVIVLTFNWARAVWARTALQLAAEEERRRPPPNARTRVCWTASTTTRRHRRHDGAGEALAPLAERLGRRVGPLPPLLGVGPRLLGVLGPARRRGLLRLPLELLCARAELVGAGLGLRIDAVRSARRAPSSPPRAAAAPDRRRARAAPCRSRPTCRRSCAGRRAPRRGRRCRSSRPRPAAPPSPRRWRGTRRRARRDTALRAAKKVSWAALNRCHSASSTSLAARPAAFHSVSRSRNAAAVGPQSVESDSSSARSHSASLACRAPARSRSSSAKCEPRRRLKASRAAEYRFHSASSVLRSSPLIVRHSSRISRSRSPAAFHCVELVASSSASAASASLRAVWAARCSSRLALSAARRSSACSTMVGQPRGERVDVTEHDARRAGFRRAQPRPP